jgi:hypothetical protein
MTKPEKPSYLDFKKESYAWKADIDYKLHPELYKVGKGEQGVLICEPYKSEIGQYWRFKTAVIATKSSKKILALFRRYMQIIKPAKNMTKIIIFFSYLKIPVIQKKLNLQAYFIKPGRLLRQVHAIQK